MEFEVVVLVHEIMNMNIAQDQQYAMWWAKNKPFVDSSITLSNELFDVM
jgi:hypothetical protein